MGMAHPEPASQMDAAASDAVARARAALGSRVVVLGMSGSGKTTLAAALGRALDAPHIELDALFWEPNWTQATNEVFRQRLAAATASDAWVVDGNYARWRDQVWPRATAFVWLDYPLPFVMARLFRRTLWRYIAGTELWNGNREQFWPQFFSRDSLFLWIIQQRPKHKREYPLIPTLPEAAGARFIRLRSPRMTARWLAGLAEGTGAPAE
jgi:adenylate kinase family enzyme